MNDLIPAAPLARLRAAAASHPYPLIFATVSGAHLYGFPSPDSDYDLRGCHVVPVREVVGLDEGRDTIEVSSRNEGLELDLVTHDVRKFFGLMLRRNGYVLEQVHSPLVVHTTPEHEELKAIAAGCVTRPHAHHYLGFAQTQWRLFEKESPRRVKPLLYVYRVLLTGIHLMRTGQVEANLVRLNADARLPHVADLIARKLAGPEQSAVSDADLGFHRREYDRLVAELEAARDASGLPETPSARSALNDLLVRIRMATAGVPERDRAARAARAREILAHITANRVIPAPGTPESTEMLREDRDR
jgi:predicted nucleotidyltransferase